MSETQSDKPEYVVAIGASAGGLSALKDFFNCLSTNTNAAFIIVQHLSPANRSILDELLNRNSTIPVSSVREDTLLKPNHAYVVSEGIVVSDIDGSILKVLPSSKPEDTFLPVNRVFHVGSIAWRNKFIAVVLSGSGSDGSVGISSVKLHGGAVLVQLPESADFEGMPESALATGHADFIGDMSNLVSHLEKLTQGVIQPKPYGEVEHKYIPVLHLLQKIAKVQFDFYKPTTINRRIERRMELNGCANLDEYLEFLNSDSEELENLHYDLLIGVTAFFRDEDAFEYLRNTTIPNIVSSTPEGHQLRLWVPGCATGEEVYSLAMAFQYEIDSQKKPVDFRIFGTDIHGGALATAGAGIYHKNSVEGKVPGEFIDRFFNVKDNYRYQITLELRKKIIFSLQNLVTDPPFTFIDFISCRNLLIYFNQKAQQKAIRILHYSLKVNGTLFLGSSETVGEQLGFNINNQTWKIYQKNSDVKERFPDYSISFDRYTKQGITKAPLPPSDRKDRVDIVELCDSLLTNYIPSSFVTNDNFEVVYAFGKARDILRFPSGHANLSVSKVLPGHTGAMIYTGLLECRRKGTRVRVSDLDIEELLGNEALDAVIDPVIIRNFHDTYFFVSLLPKESQDPSPQYDSDVDKVSALQSQLKEMRQSLVVAHQELEANNEQLQSSNEELMTSNEELQSTNEELHSLNEELHTVNTEHQQKIDELARTNFDLDNLIHSTKVATFFLDERLHIRRATDNIDEYFYFLPSDIDRPFTDIKSKFSYPELYTDLEKVLNRAVKEIEREIFIEPSQWAFLRVLPYTGDIHNKGVVLSCVDITEVKKIGANFTKDNDATSRTLESMLHLNPIPTMAISFAGKIILANNASKDLLGYSRKELIDMSIEELIPEKMRAGHAKMREMFIHERLGKRSLGQGRILPVLTKSGEEIPCDIALYRMVTDKGGYILCILVDSRPPYRPR